MKLALSRLSGITVTLAVLLACGGHLHAQWKTETYNLKGGWNSIYLHGDATHASPAQHFGTGPTSPAEPVLEVWRWNPNPNQVQFTNSPLIPALGTPEWSVWKRDGSEGGLADLTGNHAYLVKCAGNAADNYPVPIVQSPLPPSATWVRSGANLLGFPSFKNGASFPTFSNYFATFPAAIAANSKVFKYVGGDFGPANPIQVFSPAVEQLDRNKAYWFESAVVGNFYAPIEISFTNPEGLDFGRSGAVITARIRNRSEATVALTLAPQDSETPAPTGETVVDVPLTLRTYNAGTLSWDEAAITGPIQQVVGPQDAVEVHFGIDRGAMTAPAGDLYASFLRVTDSGNLMDAWIPARASVASLAGLWAGDAIVSKVESKADGTPGDPTPRPFPLRILLHLDDGGEARLLSQVFLGPLAEPGNPVGLCTRELGLKQDAKASALRLSVAHLPLDQAITAGSGSVALGASLVRTISIPWNDPTNPFMHQYHPDHDNRDARPDGTNVPKGNGEESYTIDRTCTFEFTASPPAGISPQGWGSSVIGGNYTEILSGLHKETITVGGAFVLRRVSEIGSITVN